MGVLWSDLLLFNASKDHVPGRTLPPSLLFRHQRSHAEAETPPLRAVQLLFSSQAAIQPSSGATAAASFATLAAAAAAAAATPTTATVASLLPQLIRSSPHSTNWPPP